MFVKLGEATFIDVESTDSVVNDPNFNTEKNSQILSKFAQFTKNLKRIAPKANDFLYFSAVMMHAAESVALDDNGNLKVLANGEPIKVGWEKKGDVWKWSSNDPNLKPYRNSNRDIFPEEELLTAYKKWVGKPLCIDHKSSSVDHVRGFIVDTYYDHKLKRVIALCALDKKNYPDLAHKVSSGYSNNVSMGTAVGKAICSDCGRVAKAEPDFCEHMKSKSCYGEINLDLSPIELSIVVNGADPKAKIKHIIAAANNLNDYVNKKEAELKKMASINFSVKFDIKGEEKGKSFNFDQNIDTNEIGTFLEGVESTLKGIKEQYKQEFGDFDSGNSQESASSDNSLASDTNDEMSPQAPGSPKFASEEQESFAQQLKNITASIEAKINNLKQDFQQLSTKLQYHKEENMSGNKTLNKSAYYQGAGGVNEPTPGKVKYTPDPLNEKDRVNEDKQMLVDDTGPVDGLFPGDLDRKKMLARAEAEERALRRQAAVALAKEALENRKNAYFLGGGEGNEPTPGKVKYTPDPLAMKLRSQDKQMVGQKPFPDVGETDGLHPSPESVKEKDELKRKEMLRRAGLKAQFVKAANSDGTFNAGESRWNVFHGDKLILTASVNELTGNRSEIMYDSVATKDFGAKLIEKVKVSGIDAVKSLFKLGQAAPAAPAAPAAAPAAPAAPADMMGGDMAGMPGAEMPAGAEDEGKEADPAERSMNLAVQIRDLSSDLVEALRALTGEKAEMGALEGLTGEEGAPAGTSAPVGKSASVELRTLSNMRKELNGALISSMKEAVAELKDHREELELITNMFNSNSVTASNKQLVSSLVSEAFADAKKAIADTHKLMGAFVKYARGTEAMIKRAEAEAQMRKFAQTVSGGGDMSSVDSDMSDDLMDLANSSDGLGDVSNVSDYDTGDSMSDFESADDLGDVEDSDDADDNDANYVMNAKDVGNVAGNLKADDTVRVTTASIKVPYDLSTKEGRAAYRAKLAASVVETSPVLDDAHPQGGFTTDLDVKVQDQLAHVEDLKEQHKAMMDVATAPPKVRKEAAVIHQLVSEGKLDASDLDSLVAEGVDAETVKYYREYYGQVDGGKEFATELTKEAAVAAAEAEKEVYRVKLARAYELAYDMVSRGLCLDDRDAVSAQVEEIMKFNDESFDSLKRVIARHQPIAMHKQASSMPQVGVIGGGDVVSQVQHEDLYSQLSAAFSKSPRRMF